MLACGSGDWEYCPQVPPDVAKTASNYQVDTSCVHRTCSGSRSSRRHAGRRRWGGRQLRVGDVHGGTAAQLVTRHGGGAGMEA